MLNILKIAMGFTPNCVKIRYMAMCTIKNSTDIT